MRRHVERGEVALRLVVVAMAVLAGLAWAVPMVFLGREATDHAATLAGASDGGASDAGSTTDGTTSAPVDPIGRANDAQAQAALNGAVRVAQVYFAENGGYTGFGPQVAAQFDPTLKLTTGRPSPGVIGIRGVTATTVVFVAVTDGGGVLCAAADGEVVSFGRADASAPAQCTGGWG